MIQDYELIDFLREYKRPKQHYESREAFSMAMIGKFYGRISNDNVPSLLSRCKHLGLISFVANGNIRFR